MVKNNYKNENNFTKLLYNQITFGLAIIGVAFGVYFTFANPTRILENRVSSLESSTISDKELQNQLSMIQKNDLHTIQMKLEDSIIMINDLSKEIVKLQTIVEERIPASGK